MKSLLSLLGLTICCNSLSGQNYLVDSHTDALHLSSQWTTTATSNLAGVTAGFTKNGRLSFYLGIGSEIGGVEEKVRVLRPSVSCLVIKQDDKAAAISLGLNGSYQQSKIRGKAGLQAETISLGPSLQHELAVSDGFQLILGVPVAWNWTSVFISERRGYHIGNGVTIGLSCTAKFHSFYVEPSVVHSGGETAFNLQLGWVFPNLRQG